jgi:hypothetical protein
VEVEVLCFGAEVVMWTSSPRTEREKQLPIFELRTEVICVFAVRQMVG